NRGSSVAAAGLTPGPTTIAVASITSAIVDLPARRRGAGPPDQIALACRVRVTAAPALPGDPWTRAMSGRRDLRQAERATRPSNERPMNGDGRQLVRGPYMITATPTRQIAA